MGVTQPPGALCLAKGRRCAIIQTAKNLRCHIKNGAFICVKLRRIVLVESDETLGSVYGIDTEFIAGEDPAAEDTASEFSADFDSQPNQTDKEVNAHAE